nr:hypothetical protein CFP56_03904 [Quercus suber]
MVDQISLCLFLIWHAPGRKPDVNFSASSSITVGESCVTATGARRYSGSRYDMDMGQTFPKALSPNFTNTNVLTGSMTRLYDYWVPLSSIQLLRVHTVQ